MASKDQKPSNSGSGFSTPTIPPAETPSYQTPANEEWDREVNYLLDRSEDDHDQPYQGMSEGCHNRRLQTHCHLKCSSEPCECCQYAGDADWIRKGQWLEDCISCQEDDEYERGETDAPIPRSDTTGAIAIGVVALIWSKGLGLEFCLNIPHNELSKDLLFFAIIANLTRWG
ncbi:hypothetical protein J7T55_015114 [Diaporthe amygdali]|uniref:uncharacterized protein n=1 Tax=Phomopsis amygdali TaxID=1214568 RepID=UPI0022FEB35F|nr:uncharacterized protein J7T55_015114 [Diaporthe amygdali]KAJ0108680.1 hypothetical protein J7T55_015114 [Diaporthe amygdali]